MNLPVYNGPIFFKLLFWSEFYASFKQKSVTVMWRKYHVMMVYFPEPTIEVNDMDP